MRIVKMVAVKTVFVRFLKGKGQVTNLGDLHNPQSHVATFGDRRVYYYRGDDYSTIGYFTATAGLLVGSCTTNNIGIRSHISIGDIMTCHDQCTMYCTACIECH